MKQIDYDSAYDYCKKIANSHYENFPVGSFLIPADKSKYIYSIYAFARYADDIADSEKYKDTDKLDKLADFEDELNKVHNNALDELSTDTRNIFLALSNTIQKLEIPIQEFRNLLKAFRQDATKQRYGNFEELKNYSKNSANPIGHLVLYTFGYAAGENEQLFGYSDKICTALQLINFWQDVSIDLKINRIYIPENVMREFGYDYQMLENRIENDCFRNVMKYLTDKTRIILLEGNRLLELIKGRLRLELKATIIAGSEILNKIELVNYSVLSNRVTINNYDKLKILGKLLWK